ncbi:MAG: hypothetical protein QOG35_321, partial [Solirubrobacteraceae bacterium]|nr:hypothetical protein [Solirubrobacteraceae bacterium]
SSRRFVASQMDPFPGAPSTADPDVLIEAGPSPAITEIQNPANDGLVTGSDGDALYVRAGDGWCRLPATGRTGGPARFVLSGGFPLWRVFKTVMRPAIQLALLPAGAVAVHSASVELEGAGIVVAGWSESGKTETALALVEGGASFVSDKWTVLADDGTAAAFPITVGVRGWVLRHLPRLRAGLGAVPRARLGMAGVARATARPLGAGGALERAITLADRVALSPSAVRAAYGAPQTPWRVPLSAVALLTTVPGPEVSARRADPAWAAQRLARSGDFERRGLFELHDRACWALAARDPGARARILAHERAALEAMLAETTVIEVRAPFPADPRPAADAIAELL